MEENIGRRIRTLRERAGLTQEDVAEAMNVSRQAVSKWESGLSRPSSENLIRLARLLNVELTDIIGQPESKEEEPPPTPLEAPQQRSETPRKKRPIWPWMVGIIALVCVLLFVGPMVTAGLFLVNTEQDGPVNVSTGAEVEVVETALPERLYLNAAPYDHAEGYVNYGTPADPAIVEDGLLFQYRWPHTNTVVVFYQEPSATDPGLYHLYAAYTLDGTAYTIIARIAEDRADAGNPALSASGALGWKGCKVVTREDMGTSTFFFALDDDGIPYMVYMTPTQTASWDMDGDGEEELAFVDHPEGILFLDREVEGYTSYTLASELARGAELMTRTDGFYYRDGGGCIFRWFWDGALLREAPARDDSPCVYEIDPEVADTVITFLNADWSDGLDPNGPYGGQGSGLPTHRQLAYMGLQTLYDLTGQTVERCYAVATDYGVSFSLDQNTDHHSFFSFGRTAEWFGNDMVVGGVELIAWKGENTEWSPIRPVEAGDARWVYDHVPLLQAGPIVSESAGLGTDVRLHLHDGSFYEVSFDHPDGLPTRIQGVYPKGFEH